MKSEMEQHRSALTKCEQKIQVSHGQLGINVEMKTWRRHCRLASQGTALTKCQQKSYTTLQSMTDTEGRLN
jgi:hypothetical protein